MSNWGGIGYTYPLTDEIGPYGNDIQALLQSITSAASNIIVGTNPPFTINNFLNIFPQFGPEINENYQYILNMFIGMANACLIYNRWQSKWQYGMALYTAHFYTLYLETLSGLNQTLGQVVAAGSAQFPKASKSVGDVSVSYDVTSVTSDLNGWAAWKSTTFGVQLATLARLLGKGGMFIP